MLSRIATCCKIFSDFINSPLWPYQARGGGGGGRSETRMTKFKAASQKPLTLWCPNFVNFSFYPWDMFWPNFSKIDQSRGLLLPFSHRETAEIDMGGVNFGPRTTILDIKSRIFKVKPVFQWKYPNLMSRSLLPKEILWCHIFILQILHQMTHAKFHFNRLMLTLIFGIRASEPPPPPWAWRTTEKAEPDRVKWSLCIYCLNFVVVSLMV